MVYNYRNGLRAVGATQGFWLSLSEEDFAAELAKVGWGENALEQELAALRAYKAQFKLDKPAPKTVEELVEQIPEEVRPESRMGAVLAVKRRQRGRPTADEDED